MKCSDCSYWYADVDENDGTPVTCDYCHYDYDDGYAPCEEEYDSRYFDDEDDD